MSAFLRRTFSVRALCAHLVARLLLVFRRGVKQLCAYSPLPSPRLEQQPSIGMVSCVPQHVVVPPREFMWATQSVAISALPHPGALAFLRSQGIASILFLTPKHPLKYDLQDDLRDYFASTRHRWLHVDKAKGQGKVVASEATIKAGLEVRSLMLYACTLFHPGHHCSS